MASSTEIGTDSEYIETMLWLPGTYYVAVMNNNGEHSEKPYTLDVELYGSGLDKPGDAPTILLPNEQNGESLINEKAKTLFVMSSSRMKERYPKQQGEVGAIRDVLGAISTRPQVEGVIFDLDNVQAVSGETLAEIYQAWDNDPGNPFLANRLAQTIDNVVTAATARNPSHPIDGQEDLKPLFPNVEYIVLVGGDSVIPHYRIPDLTTFANQAEYNDYLIGLINNESALSASFRYRTTLTDDIYGDDRAYEWYAHPLYLPDRAVSRLVETPKEIFAYAEQYAVGGLSLEINAKAPYNAGLVTGYDFLADQASEIKRLLETMGLNMSTLIDIPPVQEWTAMDLAQKWFEGQFRDYQQSPYTIRSEMPIQAVNSHFDHFAITPSARDKEEKEHPDVPPTEPTFYALQILTPTASIQSTGKSPLYFANRLCYSLGCHSGLNVGKEAMLPGVEPKYLADFPQAYLKQGGVFIGNTGYGYGDYDRVSYSEWLTVKLTEELGRNVTSETGDYIGQTVGMAMRNAKLRYVADAVNFDTYDVKTLMQFVQYGFPFITVKVENPINLPDALGDPDVVPGTVPSQDGQIVRVITLTNTFEKKVPVQHDRYYPILKDIQVEDSFVKEGFAGSIPRIIPTVAEGTPALPQFAYDLTALNRNTTDPKRMLVRDVLFVEGSYEALPDYMPKITAIITRDRDTEPLPFPEGVGVWHPTMFYNHTTTGTEEQQRDQLVVTAGQYQGQNEDGTKGTLRLYSRLVFRVTYLDPDKTTDEIKNDTMPPVVQRVRIMTNTTSTMLQAGVQDSHMLVDVLDPSSDGDETKEGTGLSSVDASYLDREGEWKKVGFERIKKDKQREQWRAKIRTEIGTPLRFVVTVVDKAGNSSFYNGKGTLSADNIIPVKDVSVTGPISGTLNEQGSYTGVFSATVLPTTATTPITYQWTLSSGEVVGQSSTAITATFKTTGTHAVSVTVSNEANTLSASQVSDAYSFEVHSEATDPPTPVVDKVIFLPVVIR